MPSQLFAMMIDPRGGVCRAAACERTTAKVAGTVEKVGVQSKWG